MLPPLTIIPAGAGSGKTYTIQETLGQWIVDGKIAPERIVAVTFTEAAAAELRERIQSKLLGLGRLEDALKLDQAYISTIHGFGLRLLTEFAFDAGLSPNPRLLNEDEESTLTRLALAQTDKADAITSNLSHYGYKYAFSHGKSAEEVFRDDLSGFVSKLRSVGWSEESANYVKHSSSWIKGKYGQTGKGNKLTQWLREAVDHLLKVYPESLVREYGNNATAKNALTNDFRNLRYAQKDGVLDSDWELWKKLRSLRIIKVPDDYKELANVVMDAANALSTHPGPLEHALSHIGGMLTAGQDVLVHYGDSKREAGLVDYTDMIAMAAEVLLNQKGVLETLVGRIDCLVVDEFQDTNPLQFSLLWQLKEAGVPTVVVGDMKQAIMGFQGADPILFETLIKQNKDKSNPLTRNWRSQPRLMDFVNATGPGLFGADYVSLKPQGSESVLEPLEVVSFSTKAKKGQHMVRAAFVGRRLTELLNDSNQNIEDRKTKKLRRLRGGDCAVLCPTNNMLVEYAAVLRGMGLRVKLQADGWFDSRIIQIVWYALSYVANPADRHAALYLAVTELGSLKLKEALEQLIDHDRINDPILEKLERLSQNAAERTIYALVTDTIFTLNLFDVVSVWPECEQARANLLKLQAEAGEFMDANREALASGGFYGSGVQSFLAWLINKVEKDDNNNQQPEPRVLDEDAIELVTWHRSKGREWPIVSVCGLDRKIGASLPKLELGYSDFDNLSQLLDKAQIEYSPTFAATETNDKFLADLEEDAETEARRLLYVAITRARDKLIVEWPAYLAGKGLTYWSILANQAGVALKSESLKIGDDSFKCTITEGGSELPGDIDLDSEEVMLSLPTIGRRAIKPDAASTALIPDSVSPSTFKTVTKDVTTLTLETVKYGEGLDPGESIKGASLGTYLHQCFEVLGNDPTLVNKLSLITGVDVETDKANKIADSVESFEKWLQECFTVESVSRELPLLALDDNGSVISGIADLVVKTKDGVWIIDHKSDQVDDLDLAYGHYKSQLDTYAKLLTSAGEIVIGTGVNWIRKGKVTLCSSVET